MINVTKTFLPPFEEYTAMLKRAWDKSWITNNGELVIELEQRLKTYLGVRNLWFCNNGTTVLQIALKALQITGEVITTPFSYVATTNAILWENCSPVFVDISPLNFCIDVSKIENSITEKTQAILATHVYGYPCDTVAIDSIAKRHNLKVIYDGAHAFGTKFLGQSIFNYGDISTCSFHATKLFHTGEGGCIITNNDDLAKRLFLYSHFGHKAEDYYSIGINGKNSEFHAALGLCNMNYIDSIMISREKQWLFYQSRLASLNLGLLEIEKEIKYNYSYFPVVFATEQDLLKSIEAMGLNGIVPRRYFYPSLNKLPYIKYQACPVSEDIARRVLCLPMFHDLLIEEQETICDIIRDNLKKI
jgi:dTDP-4-amino-4,6-dideoxygalactose transaminase